MRGAWLAAAAVLVMAGCGGGGSGDMDPAQAAAVEAKLLGQIGGAYVPSATIVSKGGSADIDAILDAVMNAPETVSDRVAACRQAGVGEVVELRVAGASAEGLEAACGPPHSRSRDTPWNKEDGMPTGEVDFLRYGNLEVGVNGGQVVCLRVHSPRT